MPNPYRSCYVVRYARDINSTANREVLAKLLSRPEANAALRAAGHGFKEAVQYYLPKLLLIPIWHCFLYFDYIKVSIFIYMQKCYLMKSYGLSS